MKGCFNRECSKYDPEWEDGVNSGPELLPLCDDCERILMNFARSGDINNGVYAQMMYNTVFEKGLSSFIHNDPYAPFKKFRLPVTWSMNGAVEVYADSFGEAVEIAEGDNFPLPDDKDSSYAEDSFAVDEDFCNYSPAYGEVEVVNP